MTSLGIPNDSFSRRRHVEKPGHRARRRFAVAVAERSEAFQAGHHGQTHHHGPQDVGVLYVKPLPGRRNIVITRNAGYEAEGAEISDSLESALILATGEDEAMIIGGAELFATALDTATRLHLTEIHADIEGDTYFPNSDRSLWREISREPHDAEGDAPAYSFLLLEKR
jgi:dihydrofolate reductase